MINTPGALKDVYTNSKVNPVKKSSHYRFLHDDGHVSTHSAVDKDVHAFKRRVLNGGFSEQALRNLEPLMIATIDRWLIALGADGSKETKGWTKPKNMAKWSNYVTLDVLGDLCFGKPFGMLESDAYRDIPGFMLGRSKVFHVVGSASFSPRVSTNNLQIGNSPLNGMYQFIRDNTPFEQYIMPYAYHSLQRLRGFAQKAMQERSVVAADLERNGQQPRKDFVHYLSQAKDPETGKGYGPREMANDLRLLIVAGSDTSSVVMAAIFYYLTRNPAIMEKLQGELRGTFSDANHIVSGPKINSCHYLRAVIDEALRLSPPVSSSLPREIDGGGMNVDGIALPAGTVVGSGTFAMHRNEEYFAEPLTYMPERWLPKYTPAEQITRARTAFFPFSLGSRGCIGKLMAYNELSIVVGRVFWLYDVRLSPGDKTGQDVDGLYEIKDVFVASRDGPIVEFRKHVQE